ncbi:hypothetical protein MILUP08_41883 [Micromonospora lupini str. Lupac 08]|uniref:Uncharacterized protein n=1 Tax=Micromonospora lupini str. Lupac 08 TaxID=1150864 RepID=I0KZG9_9ACTN|nr:hypothetical protein MILUP08_41883 [Micromonospora lupini str. Lupac 08]
MLLLVRRPEGDSLDQGRWHKGAAGPLSALLAVWLVRAVSGGWAVAGIHEGHKASTYGSALRGSSRRLTYQTETPTVRAAVDLSTHRGQIIGVRGATRPITPPPMTLRATLKLTQA